MEMRNIRKRPEDLGAARLRRYMKIRGWWFKKIHGGKYQSGLPDLLALHKVHGLKWIETKAPGGKLRASQIKLFSEFESYGQEVYVLENETHYQRLFKPKGNWKNYVRI